MIPIRTRRLILAAALALTAPAALGAQSVDIGVVRVQMDTWRNPAVRIGQDYALKAEDAVREVLVIGGDATIEGRVDRDVVVILGKATIAKSAVIDGSVAVIGGTAVMTEGAQIREDFIVVGGVEGYTAFSPGGHYVTIGPSALGRYMRGIVPWLLQGLLWGRPIVPSLGWVWTIAGIFFLVNLLLNMIMDTPVRASTLTLRATPVSAFMSGLLVMLLIGPICVLLAVSVIGIAVVPFVVAAALFAAIIGKIAFARWIGMSVIHQEDPADKLASLRSFLIGSAAMCLLYTVPLLGFVTWTLAGVFGLGAATLAFSAAYRRENPKKPKPPKAAPVPLNNDEQQPPAAQPPPFEAPAAPAQLHAEPASAGGGATAYSASAPEEPAYISAAPAAAFVGGGLLAFPRAAFLERLAAFTLDFILVCIVAEVLRLDRFHDGPLGRAGMILAIAYHVGFWTWKGTTLGGIICNLRVVKTDGSALQFAESLVRGLTGIFSLAVLGLGFLWIIRDPEQQAWHDRVAGTYVVKVPRTYPI